VHVTAFADLRCVHDDEQVVRIHMDSGNVISVPASTYRHRMKVELVREQRFCLVTPFRNVEPEKSVGALQEGAQLAEVALGHTFGVDPAQFHRQSPFRTLLHHYPSERLLQHATGPGAASGSKSGPLLNVDHG
jgi:hypothetical protein